MFQRDFTTAACLADGGVFLPGRVLANGALAYAGGLAESQPLPGCRVAEAAGRLGRRPGLLALQVQHSLAGDGHEGRRRAPAWAVNRLVRCVAG